MRNFATVLKEICNAMPEHLSNKLSDRAMYWAPEIVWLNLNRFVHSYVPLNSKDDDAVKIYAILCDKTEEEMRKMLEEDGL